MNTQNAPSNALTSLDDILGHTPQYTGNNMDNSVYGAEFKERPRIPQYYERIDQYTIVPPWLAKKQEKTFMNNIKRLNEDPVKTYKELEYTSVDDNVHDAYEQVIYGYGEDIIGKVPKPIPVTQIEGFSPLDYLPKTGYLTNLVILFAVTYLIYLFINQY